MNDKQFNPDDPLFPKTVNAHDEHKNFIPTGLGREHWANASPVRTIFGIAFERVSLPYVKPHTVRDTITQLGYSLNLNVEQFKAWSQNMGHDHPLTTIKNYAPMTIERQAEIINGLGNPAPTTAPMDDMAEKIAQKLAVMLEKAPHGKN